MQRNARQRLTLHLSKNSAVFWLVQCLFTSAQETVEGIEHENAQGLYAIGHSSKHP
jgi:hypothetical protein